MSGFADNQIRALRRTVNHRHIQTRSSGGKELSYVEGWFAISEANRIFGFDGWDRETIEAKCIQVREVRGQHSVSYTARVRITVRPGERVVVRDGYGTGEGRGDRLGEAHDLALKTAETDATKRALVTFGNAFGLSLYSSQRRQRGQDETATTPDTGARLVAGSNGSDVSVDAFGGNRPAIAARIDKSQLTLSEPRRIRDKEHLRYVGSQPCIVCNRILAEAHHVRYAQPKALGAKVSDEFTVPLCRDHHRELHNNGNERAWWHDMGIEPLPVARRLWEESQTSLRSRQI
jgi:DNA recombination protein Rad52